MQHTSPAKPALYRGTYRIASARLRDWDYGASGWYFVTICTKDRVCWFGDVQETNDDTGARVILSDIGTLAEHEWKRTPLIRPSVVLDQWIIMPNHLHGILVIDSDNDAGGMQETRHETCRQETRHETCRQETRQRRVSTTTTTMTTVDITGIRQPPGMPPASLSVVINQFKGACTKRIRSAGHKGFSWQERFHDHIIRDEKDLARIREYIMRNPLHWISGDDDW